MVLSHKVVDGVEQAVAADVDDWICDLGWLRLQWLLWNGSCKSLCYGLCHGLGPGLCLPFVGLIRGPICQGTLARVHAW